MKRLQAFWVWVTRRRVASPGLPAAPLAPDWKPEHARDLKQFLSSTTGQTLLARARAMEYATALASVRAASVGETSLSTFSEAINWLESLSRATGDQAATSGVPSGERDDAEPEFAENL